MAKCEPVEMSTKVTSKFTFFVVFIVVVSTINRFENLIGSDRLRSKIRALRFRSLPLKHGIMSRVMLTILS